MERHYSVAIDGPSGAGKSTIARAAAQRFGFLYVDTGAIYRTVGLAVERRGIAYGDSAAVGALVDVGLPAALAGAGAAADLHHVAVAPPGQLPPVDPVQVDLVGVAAALHQHRDGPLAVGAPDLGVQPDPVRHGQPDLLDGAAAARAARRAGVELLLHAADGLLPALLLGHCLCHGRSSFQLNSGCS